MTLRGVRVVSLDAMNTIVRLREAPSVVYARVANECGIEAKAEDVAARFPKAFRRFEKEKPCYDFAGEGARRWWSDVVAESLGFAADTKDSRVQKVQSRLFDFYASAESWQLVDEEAVAHLELLKKRQIGVVVVSNIDHRLRRILDDLQIAPLIDHVFMSGEIGFQKPDRRLFEHVLARLHLSESPDSLLHIGDHRVKDFAAARAVGIRALLLDKEASSPPSATPSIRSLSDLFE